MKRFIEAFGDHYGKPNPFNYVYVNTDQILYMETREYKDYGNEPYTMYIIYCASVSGNGLAGYHISKEDYEELINEEREK